MTRTRFQPRPVAAPARNPGKPPSKPAGFVERIDPFTTDNARIADLAPTPAFVERQIRERIGEVAVLFGGRGEIKWKKYFAQEGNWTVGFASVFGFHIRGRGVVLLEAIEAAKRSRLPDDPGGPEWKRGVNL